MVVKSKLPDLGTPEWTELVEFHITALPEAREKKAKELGLLTTSYERRMRERGVHAGSQQHTTIVKEEPVYNFPALKLRDYKSPRPRKGDEETAILLASDGHADKITKSYNKDIYRSRMERMFSSIMTIVSLHRNMYPIRKFRILNLGDNSQGENVHQGSRPDTITMGARDQTMQLTVPTWSDLIGSLKQNFTEVIFDGWGGNHGHERLAPETSREDLRLYDILQTRFEKEKGISINVHEEFGSIISIDGFKFFCFHGDGIPCQQGVPEMAIERRLKAWFIQFGGFHYACGAHFHKRIIKEIAAGVEYIMNSTLVSDDDWVLKKLGISSQPSQWLIGVHPRHGVTWRYPLIVDEAFLPT